MDANIQQANEYIWQS